MRFVKDSLTVWFYFVWGQFFATLILLAVGCFFVLVIACVQALLGGIEPTWFYNLLSWTRP